jgi:glycosyltransferase involved in cell wall biosynthesis
MKKDWRPELVFLVGRYPPPYGGVSVHIYRLRALLTAQSIKSIVIDLKSRQNSAGNTISIWAIRKWLLALVLNKSAIHIHVSEINLKNALGIAAASLLAWLTQNKLLLTVHSTAGCDMSRSSEFRKLLLRAAFVNVHHFIAVGSTVLENLRTLRIDSKKASVIPAFLPPKISFEDSAEIPNDIFTFIANRTPILTANAFEPRFYNHEDMYGIDLCVDLCANLRHAYPQVGFVFCISNVTNYDYFCRLQQRVAASNIQDNFLFITHSYQFYVLLMRSDVFLRPTNTDGDAISVREALYFEIPAIASDVVPRPAGVVLFKNRDIADLTAKVKDVLDNYQRFKTKLRLVDTQDNFKKILDLYKRIFEET